MPNGPRKLPPGPDPAASHGPLVHRSPWRQPRSPLPRRYKTTPQTNPPTFVRIWNHSKNRRPNRCRVPSTLTKLLDPDFSDCVKHPKISFFRVSLTKPGLGGGFPSRIGWLRKDCYLYPRGTQSPTGVPSVPPTRCWYAPTSYGFDSDRNHFEIGLSFGIQVGTGIYIQPCAAKFRRRFLK